MRELDFICHIHAKALRAQYSTRNKDAAVSAASLYNHLSKKLDVSVRTIQAYARDHKKLTAACAHYMARAVGFGGITFHNLTTELDCGFSDVLHVLYDAHRESQTSTSSLASILGFTGTAMAKRYLNEAYATKNLTFLQFMRWALSVNLGHTTFHNKTMGANMVIYGFNVPLADLKHDLPREYEELIWDNKSAAAYALVEPGLNFEWPAKTRAVVQTYVKRRGLVGATPTPAGLHLPLLMLVRVLRSEMQRQNIEPEDMFDVVDPETLEHWCEGTIIFPGSSAKLDLTLRRLDRWCQRLGFGRLMCPTFGSDFNAAGEVILSNLTLAEKLSPGALGAMFGAKYSAVQLSNSDWMDLPAVFWEYLSIWAWADGLAFEKNAGHSGHVYKGWSPEQAARSAAVARVRVTDRVAKMLNQYMEHKRRPTSSAPSMRSSMVASGGYKGGNAAIELLDFQSFDADIHHIAEHA